MVAQFDQHPAFAGFGNNVHAGNPRVFSLAIAPGVLQQVDQHLLDEQFVCLDEAEIRRDVGRHRTSMKESSKRVQTGSNNLVDGERHPVEAQRIPLDLRHLEKVRDQPVQAIGLGCTIDHAGALVYSDGFDLDNARLITPVGVTCRLCERTQCPQRALPSLKVPLRVDPNYRGLTLYAPVVADP